MGEGVSTQHGGEAFTRVFRDGVDVIDHPERYPWPYSEYFAKGWRPGMEWDNRFRPGSSRVPRQKKN